MFHMLFMVLFAFMMVLSALMAMFSARLTVLFMFFMTFHCMFMVLFARSLRDSGAYEHSASDNGGGNKKLHKNSSLYECV
jgi:hypothetical protein